MTIARIIEGKSADIIACGAATTVGKAVALLADKRIGALPVLDGGTVAGIFSERDAIFHLARHGTAMLEQTVGAVMTAPAITVGPDIGALEALALMTRRRIRHLPVIDDGRMVGFVSIGDLVKYRIDRIEAEAEAMRAYIQTA